MLEKILAKQVVVPAIIIVVSFILYFILKAIINKIFEFKISRNSNVDKKRVKTISSLFTNTIKFFIIAIAAITILDVFGIDTKSIIASLGVFSAVLALALQDILKDFVAGIFIIVEGQFRIGDVITIDGFKGEVIALSLKTTRVKAYTGEVKMFANRNVTSIINHTIDKSLAIVDVGVAYESDLDKVEKVLNNLLEKLNKEYEELTGEFEILGVNELGSSSIVYRIVAPTKSMKHLDVQRKLMRAIKVEFDKNNIVIPYNQLVIHNG